MTSASSTATISNLEAEQRHPAFRRRSRARSPLTGIRPGAGDAEITLDQIVYARDLAAKIIARAEQRDGAGSVYLPVFNRLEREISARRQVAAGLARALAVAAGAD